MRQNYSKVKHLTSYARQISPWRLLLSTTLKSGLMPRALLTHLSSILISLIPLLSMNLWADFSNNLLASTSQGFLLTSAAILFLNSAFSIADKIIGFSFNQLSSDQAQQLSQSLQEATLEQHIDQLSNESQATLDETLSQSPLDFYKSAHILIRDVTGAITSLASNLFFIWSFQIHGITAAFYVAISVINLAYYQFSAHYLKNIDKKETNLTNTIKNSIRSITHHSQSFSWQPRRRANRRLDITQQTNDKYATFNMKSWIQSWIQSFLEVIRRGIHPLMPLIIVPLSNISFPLLTHPKAGLANVGSLLQVFQVYTQMWAKGSSLANRSAEIAKFSRSSSNIAGILNNMTIRANLPTSPGSLKNRLSLKIILQSLATCIILCLYECCRFYIHDTYAPIRFIINSTNVIHGPTVVLTSLLTASVLYMAKKKLFAFKSYLGRYIQQYRQHKIFKSMTSKITASHNISFLLLNSLCTLPLLLVFKFPFIKPFIVLASIVLNTMWSNYFNLTSVGLSLSTPAITPAHYKSSKPSSNHITLNDKTLCTQAQSNKEWHLSNKHLHYDTGKSHVIIGASGSGKTSLLDHIVNSAHGVSATFSVPDNTVCLACPQQDIIDDLTTTDLNKTTVFHGTKMPLITKIALEEIYTTESSICLLNNHLILFRKIQDFLILFNEPAYDHISSAALSQFNPDDKKSEQTTSIRLSGGEQAIIKAAITHASIEYLSMMQPKTPIIVVQDECHNGLHSAVKEAVYRKINNLVREKNVTMFSIIHDSAYSFNQENYSRHPNPLKFDTISIVTSHAQQSCKKNIKTATVSQHPLSTDNAQLRAFQIENLQHQIRLLSN